MIKIGPALPQITTHRLQNFSVDSPNLYPLGVHGNFQLKEILFGGHVKDKKIFGPILSVTEL